MPNKKPWLINPSTILGLVASFFLILGLVLPAMDFSKFHKEVHIKYNILKICENVSLISDVWRGIPFGLILGIVVLVILSFVKIPVLKIVPSILITAMVAIIAVDVKNIVNWVLDTLHRFNINTINSIGVSDVIRSFMPGFYFLIIGLIIAYISCFFKVIE